MRVELGAAALEHHLASFVGLVGGPVDPVGGECVEDVGDRGDPALDGDLLTRETVGVAGAVDPLVMGERQERGQLEQLDVRAGEDAVADRGVRLHDQTLFVGQSSGLQENPVRDPDLADVVHRAGDSDQLHALRLDSGEPRQQGAVEAHPNDVLTGLLAAELGRRREPPDRLLPQSSQLPLGALEPRDRLAQARGALEHGVLEAFAMAAILDLERAPPQGVDHVDHKLVRLERLQHISVGTVLERCLRVLAIVKTGDHHDRDVRVGGRHLTGEVEP